jgi:hypothetical protein
MVNFNAATIAFSCGFKWYTIFSDITGTVEFK